MEKHVQPLEYNGSLGKQQLEGTSKYQRIELEELSEYQNHLYHRALFGLSIFSQEEIKKMNKEKRKRIIKVHKKTQKVLNIWKQEVVLALSNNFFMTIFPDSPMTKTLLDVHSETDPTYKCTLSFKTLKMNKSSIIERLITEGILPHNFNNLNT
jgi:aryl-alcohol dehydrogenase-like predicted oxidoreductase